MKTILATWLLAVAIGAAFAYAVYALLGTGAAIVWLGACTGSVQWLTGRLQNA